MSVLQNTHLIQESESSQQIFVMRHAERVDFTFEDWMSSCFTESGTYICNNLNLPASLPQRADYPSSFSDDTPITNLGVYESRLTGQALLNAGTEIKYAYSSPALRSIDTCNNVLEGLGIRDKLRVRIEPALFEWLFWYQARIPMWLNTQEYLEAGYNIDTSYTPFMTRDELEKQISETCEQFYQRNYNFVQKILQDTNGDGNILIVGHGPSLDACTRQLRGLPPRNATQMSEILHKVHYCNMIRAYVTESSWKIAESSAPCFTNSMNRTFDWKVLLDD